MRRTLPFIALLVFAAPASAQSGGADVPPYNGPVTQNGGGAVYEKPKAKPKKPRAKKPRRRASGGPVLSTFRVRAKRFYLLGAPATVSFRIDSRRALRDVRLYLVPTGSSKPASTIKLGPLARGTDHSVRLTGAENGTLAQGSYTVRVAAKDSRGRRLRKGAGISSTAALSFLHHRFPVAGAFSWGNEGSRFGAGRSGHRHQGQDLAAAEGTPVVAPRGGTVKTVAYQASGAGHYVVLSAPSEGRDYVFMHLRTGSITVTRGQAVRTGQRIGQVGNTGRSFGAHLHFEIWTGGGWYTGGKPVDPWPYLRAWPR